MTFFITDSYYSRSDIYRILEVPKEKQKGIWNTGYVKYNNDWFVFIHINTAGKTGHNYNNHFIGNDLVWFGKTNSHIHQPSIQSLLNPLGNVYIFVREDNNNPYFRFSGIGIPHKVEDEIPVKITWALHDPHSDTFEKPSEEISEMKKTIQ